MDAQTPSPHSLHTDPLPTRAKVPHACGAGAADAGLFDPVLVWDAPTRLVYWLMAACLAGAWATAGEGGWPQIHETLGSTIAGLALFRIAWGFAGTRHARFSSFVKGPRAIARCLRSLRHGWAGRPIGHSPPGAALLIAVLLLALIAGASGWAGARFAPMRWLGDVHEVAAHAMLALAALHIAAAVFGSWRAGDNPLRSIVRGTRLGAPAEAIPSARGGMAWLVLVAVLGFWVFQWRSASDVPAPPVPRAMAVPA
ncbi:hypothetical protein GCM10023165_17630 [Variovorax defluvii]|uniref:Cytochrome b561 bacterial/Ni-hydrogenase domain-containing protein n=1 Tax=Variovorax defluvii TaxID=913761 RepID=A0ABP8HFT2_9BURK